MVTEYKGAWALFRQDKNFTADELDYMLNIYTGINTLSLHDALPISIADFGQF